MDVVVWLRSLGLGKSERRITDHQFMRLTARAADIMQYQSSRWLGISLNSDVGNSMGRHKTGLASPTQPKLDRSRAHAPQSPA